MQHTQTYGSNLKQCLEEKFIAADAYISKEERSQINSLSFHVQALEGRKRSKSNPKQGEGKK